MSVESKDEEEEQAVNQLVVLQNEAMFQRKLTPLKRAWYYHVGSFSIFRGVLRKYCQL